MSLKPDLKKGSQDLKIGLIMLRSVEVVWMKSETVADQKRIQGSGPESPDPEISMAVKVP